MNQQRINGFGTRSEHTGRRRIDGARELRLALGLVDGGMRGGIDDDLRLDAID